MDEQLRCWPGCRARILTSNLSFGGASVGDEVTVLKWKPLGSQIETTTGEIWTLTREGGWSVRHQDGCLGLLHDTELEPITAKIHFRAGEELTSE